MDITKRGYVKITYPKMRPLRAIAVMRLLHDMRRSEVELTAYVHPNDILIALHSVKDNDANDS